MRNPGVRKDILELTQEELDYYRIDVLRVGDPDRSSPWQKLGSIHTEWCLHYQEAFLPWHNLGSISCSPSPILHELNEKVILMHGQVHGKFDRRPHPILELKVQTSTTIQVQASLKPSSTRSTSTLSQVKCARIL